MSIRRLVCFLLGAWLGGSVFMFFVATGNFHSVDRLLEKPAPRAAKLIDALGPEGARALLRHQVGEINREYFQNWEIAQLLLAALVFLLLLFGTSERRLTLVMPLVMGACLAVMHWGITPRMIEVGQEVDFLAAGQMTPARARMQVSHRAYGVMESVKLAAGLTLLGLLLFRRRHRRHVGKQLDVVDHADHRHVDR